VSEASQPGSGEERSLRLGVWLGVDVGSVRVGVARCDPDGLLATPLVTLRRDPDGGADLRELAALAAEHRARGVVVGMPIGLSGRLGPAAAAVRAYVEALRTVVSPLVVETIDERLSTVAAHRNLASRGIGNKRRRPLVDQEAAAIILEQWLAHRHR
jgi:putative Holliday junction resolvase